MEDGRWIWLPIEEPRGIDKWEGVVRHRVDVTWVDGMLQGESAVDVWERREPRFHPGDRIILYEGMGNYAIGIYVKEVGGMAQIREDGYTEPDGTPHLPYDYCVNYRAVQPEPKGERQPMREGFTPIYAELKPGESAF